MASLMEIMQLCRLCLVKDQVNIPIFEEQGDIRQIFLKISACLPVKVSREDNLPKKICDGCSYKLEILYQFWNTSANSEKQLLKWLSEVGAKKAPASDKVAVAPVQPHSMPSDGVILKQEVVDLADSHSADEIAPDDLNVSSDAQDYIMQQQQLPYQPISFQFQQDGFAEGEAATNASGPSATVTSEATEAAPKRKRRAAAMKALPAHIDSEEEEDEDDVDMVETKIAKTEEQTDDSGGEDPEPTAFVGVPSTSTDNEQPGPSGVGKGSAEAPFYEADTKVSSREGIEDAKLPSVNISNIRSALKKALTNSSAPSIPNSLAIGIIRSALLSACSSQIGEVDHNFPNECSVDVKPLLINITNQSCVDINEEVDTVEVNPDVKISSGATPNPKINICVKPDSCAKKRTKINLPVQASQRGYSVKLPHNHLSMIKIVNVGRILRRYRKTQNRTSKAVSSQPNNCSQLQDQLCKTEKTYLCQFCMKCFSSVAEKKRHRYAEHMTKKFECDKCDKKFYWKRHLDQHSEMHLEGLAHVCSMCKRQYKTSFLLQLHYRRYHSGKSKKFICQECGNRFISNTALQMHAEQHKGVIYKCDRCPKFYSYLGSLNEHKKRHENPEFKRARSHRCKICGEIYATITDLKSHKQSIHNLRATYVCHICGITVTSNNSLQKHISVHQNIKPYTCGICGKSFHQKGALIVHLRVHTKEKPYCCSYCDKCYSQINSLKIHVRTVHTKERPYECHVCQERFVTKTLMKTHARVHGTSLADISKTTESS